MISKKLHLELINKWSKVGKVYSLRNKRVIARLKWFDKHLELLDGLNVLEVGSNSGLMAIDICKHAKFYIGLEKKEVYYRQSLQTLTYALDSQKAHFCNLRLSEYDHNVFPFSTKLYGVVLSRVLYYLKDGDIEVLKDILKNCKVALVFCGSTNERKLNKYGFHKAKNTKKFFEDNGFKFEVDLVHSRYYGGIATK